MLFCSRFSASSRTCSRTAGSDRSSRGTSQVRHGPAYEDIDFQHTMQMKRGIGFEER